MFHFRYFATNIDGFTTLVIHSKTNNFSTELNSDRENIRLTSWQFRCEQQQQKPEFKITL